MSSPGNNYSQFDISLEEKDNLVRSMIRYILFKTEQNGGCPIKRDELTQLITAKNYKQRNLASYIINEAKSKLSTVFGYEMRELQRLRPSSANASQSQSLSTDVKSYIIISQLPADVYSKHVEDASKSHMTGFTFVVIAVVQLAGGKISEENLWHHLGRLGLLESDENHPLLGNIKLALEKLVQQRLVIISEWAVFYAKTGKNLYLHWFAAFSPIFGIFIYRYLQKDKVNCPEGNILYYGLAERSLDAAVDSKVKEYISQIVQKDLTSVDA